MKKFLYSVYDYKAQYHGNPFTSINHATAIREFSAACAQPGSQLYDHPTDFVLFAIATYDDQTGVVEPIPHINLGLAANCFNRSVPDSPSLVADSEVLE